eukprot:GHVQ01025477.1.p1 GENE.GHVQ01025477.1~~GHVQ01025477.1.p1  ORF type:complete len:225 (-),score=20.38 GHVQ01025477.1:149-823(-)
MKCLLSVVISFCVVVLTCAGGGDSSVAERGWSRRLSGRALSSPPPRPRCLTAASTASYPTDLSTDGSAIMHISPQYDALPPHSAMSLPRLSNRSSPLRRLVTDAQALAAFMEPHQLYADRRKIGAFILSYLLASRVAAVQSACYNMDITLPWYLVYMGGFLSMWFVFSFICEYFWRKDAAIKKEFIVTQGRHNAIEKGKECLTDRANVLAQQGAAMQLLGKLSE